MKIRELMKPAHQRAAALILLLSWAIPWIGIFSFSIMASGRAVADERFVVVDQETRSEEPNSLRRAEVNPVPDRQAVQANDPLPEVTNYVAPEKQPVAVQNQKRPVPAASPAPTRNNKVRNIDLNLLARVIYAEARGEPFEGQVAVGAVLVNRVLSSKFPDDLWSVVFKRGEFCTVRDGQVWLEPNETAYRAAKLAKDGWDPTNGALYFYNPSKTTSKWIWSRPVTTQIGSHLFAR